MDFFGPPKAGMLSKAVYIGSHFPISTKSRVNNK
jgi:hypothetical protein